MPTEKPRRRWFRPRYSLATLFVVVTAVGCWLGVQMKWAKDRRSLLRQDGVVVITTWMNLTMGVSPSKTPPAPWSLRILGEPGIGSLVILTYDRRDEELITEVRRLFPEAHISTYPN